MVCGYMRGQMDELGRGMRDVRGTFEVYELNRTNEGGQHGRIIL